jgi:leucyl aminopeptidase
MFSSIRATSSSRQSTPCLILGHFKGEPLGKLSASLDASGAALLASKRSESTGDRGVVVEAFPSGKSALERVILVGLGERASFNAEAMRSVAAAVGRKLAALKLESARVDFSEPLISTKADAAVMGNAFGEAVGILGWVCDTFKGSASTSPKRSKLALSFDTSAPIGAKFFDGVQRGLALAESTNICRTLSQTPPNVATPAWMANEAKKIARKTGMSVKVFEGDELERQQFTGLINVGKASENKPCMIRVEYTPKGVSKNSKPLVLIGKTITYDTGGLSLKINNGMVGMKRDKDGGCAVLGAMHAIATVIKPKKRVVALLVSAENSISDEAYRPDDVLTYRNGVTVEVTNTDAEGRLVLADALIWACEQEDPSGIIDLATLTGGVVVALGSTYCGMFCENDKLRGKIEAASAKSGERVWRLPMHQEYRDMMKSPVADILNSNANRKAHPIQGAAFLSYFVDEKIPWCHLDIAGVHATESNKGMFIDGPTGWGVRLLAEMIDGE